MSQAFPRVAGTVRDKSILVSLGGWTISFLNWVFAGDGTKCETGPVLGTGPEGILSPLGNEIPFFPEGQLYPEAAGPIFPGAELLFPEAAESLVLPETPPGSGSSIPRRCITYNNRERCYYAYVPACADGPVPLMIDIHAWSFCPTATMVWSGWRETAEEECFAVMWPIGNMDGPPILGFPSWANSVEEFDYIRAMGPDMANYIIDASNGLASLNGKKIYASGLSNGGIASLGIVMRHSDYFAATSSFSGGWADQPAIGYSPTPIIAFHGIKDVLIPYRGSTFPGGFPSFPDAFDSLQEIHNCSTITTDEFMLPDMDLGNEQGKLTLQAATDCNNGADLRYHTFNTAGHITIGGVPEVTPAPPFATSTTLDTVMIAWDFLNQYELNEEPSEFRLQRV